MPETPPTVGVSALLSVIAMQLMLTAGVMAAVFWRRPPVEWLGLRWRWWPSVFVLAPAAVGVTWIFMLALQASPLLEWLLGPGATEQQDVVEAFGMARDPLNFFLLCVMAVLVAPVTEEVVFRGYFYPVVRRFAGRWPGILCSALVFAMVHHSAVALIPLCFLAIVLALTYEWTGSIWAPIAVHMLFNSATVAMQIAIHFGWIQETAA
jgi:membrane protease YdiL (CAAX protease family)